MIHMHFYGVLGVNPSFYDTNYRKQYVDILIYSDKEDYIN